MKANTQSAESYTKAATVRNEVSEKVAHRARERRRDVNEDVKRSELGAS